MFNQEEMDALAQRAKEQLQGMGNENNSVGDDGDLYAEFREDGSMDEMSAGTGGDYNASIQHQPSSYRDNPMIDTNRDNALNYGSHDEQLEPGDYRIFENGPLFSEINSWKKQWDGAMIFVTEVNNITFVFRTLNRFEYKQIVALPNVDGLQREEIICETCVLHPRQYTWKEMATTYAGVPSTLAEIIMGKSGFTKEYQIQVL